MWQHIQECIDEQVIRLMDILFQKLNNKLDAVRNQTFTKNDNKGNASKFQSRLINLTYIKFTREQIQTLSLGPNYAIDHEPKQYIKELIIDTEKAIRLLQPKMQNT